MASRCPICTQSSSIKHYICYKSIPLPLLPLGLGVDHLLLRLLSLGLGVGCLGMRVFDLLV